MGKVDEVVRTYAHADVTPEQWAEIERKLRDVLTEAMSIPESRISRVSLLPDPGRPTKTLLDIQFDPPLTDSERELYRFVIETINTAMGGSPAAWASKG
jgi:hypothetical protein